MKYPDFLKKGDGIAVTAISDGIVEEKKLLKYENAIKNIRFGRASCRERV